MQAWLELPEGERLLFLPIPNPLFKGPPASHVSTSSPETLPFAAATSPVIFTSAIQSVGESQSNTLPSASTSATATQISPPFIWGDVSGGTYTASVENAYEEVVFWGRNVFDIPTNGLGRAFVDEVTKLLNAFVSDHPMENIAMKAIGIITHLLLQRPHSKSTSSENKQHLARRLLLWKSGDIPALVREARTLQTLFQQQRSRRFAKEDDLTRRFTHLMLNGKVQAAIRLVTDHSKGGILPLSPEVYASLQQKHPPSVASSPEVLISGCVPDVQPIRFAGITAALIRQSALHTNGGAGPSGADADQWRRMCVSFSTASANLCASLAAVARRLATEDVCPQNLEAFLSNRLIPLDKCPGIRPIGIGEVPRRIIGKTIIRHLRNDIQQASGPIQLCAGIEAGCEAAIHAIVKLFQSDESDAVLLIDADNAFNRLNRHTALWNIQFICPSLAFFAKNCYRLPSRLFVIGGAELASQEGTTQGDPLAMPLYALSLMPLIHELHGLAHQIWYADDAQATGRLIALRHWWDTLVQKGPGYGYFVNACKTLLVVKPSMVEEAATVFHGTGIKLQEGARDLGSAIGSDSYVQLYVGVKVENFCQEIETLSHIAVSSPHAVHAAFVHALRHRWRFLQRTLPNSSTAFEPLEQMIRGKFIPALLGGRLVSDAERALLSLPGKYGGFAIDNPVQTAAGNHEMSKRLTEPLVDQLLTQDLTLRVNHNEQSLCKATAKRDTERRFQKTASEVKATLNPDQQRAMLAAQEAGASALVTTLPLRRHGFALTKTEFRDQFLMRYRWPLPDLPVTCACGSPFTVDHSQICQLGGFVHMRHDEVRDILALEMRTILKDVEVEPHLTKVTGEILHPGSANITDEARADIRARGFWCQQQNAYFDVRVFYPHASSYVHQNLPALYASMEKRKKREYNDRILQIEQGSFTPLVFATTGGMGQEATAALKKLASCLAEKRQEPYSQVLGLLRCRLSFALMRAANVCLRGSRPIRLQHSLEHSEVVIHDAQVET
jgi:hypothetical protein